MAIWTSTRESGATGESWTSDEFPGYVIRHSDGMPYYDIDMPTQHAPARRSHFNQAENYVRLDAHVAERAAEFEAERAAR